MTHLEVALIVISLFLLIFIILTSMLTWTKIKQGKQAQKEQYQKHCEKLDIIQTQLKIIKELEEEIAKTYTQKK